jgi:PAS domain S-box-containing protein
MALFVALTPNALSYAVWIGAGVLRASDEERQLAEAERAQSEERLRRAVADAPAPMVIHDASGRILHMSQGWSLYSGYTLAEVPTMQAWIAATQPTGASPFDAYLAFAGNAVKTVQGGEWTITTLSGEKRTWDFSTTPVVGDPGSPDRTLVTIAVDVTDRKLFETGLRKLNEDLEQRMAERTAELTRTSDSLRRQSDRVNEQTTMLDLVRGGILVRDLYGTILYWSAGAAEMYGWTKEEAVGKISHRLIRSELPVPMKDIEKQVTSTGSWEGDIVQTRKDGTRLAVESRWTLMRTDRERPHRFLEVNRDITARKDTERALEEQVSELARSNHELEQFASIVSHDLQEPLRTVSSYTELLVRRYKDKLDSDANEYIDFAVSGTRRMHDLIQGLLQYARVGSRGGEYTPTPIEQVVNAALMNLSAATADANAEITVGVMPALVCDPAQLTQVFQNLISNAIKFRRPGDRPVIRISAHHEEGRWSFHVADNGIGIERKYFERIFQMFQRLHGRDEYAGTGIGLALCKKIIERHGGEMRVASEPGRGTTFSFTIPDGLRLEA